LKGKVKFPRNFDKDAKSLVKHLLVADLTKRYGNLKGGANDIKTHRWFAQMDWDQLIQKKIVPIYKPVVKYTILLATSGTRAMPRTTRPTQTRQSCPSQSSLPMIPSLIGEYLFMPTRHNNT
jgi:hypothetical protein